MSQLYSPSQGGRSTGGGDPQTQLQSRLHGLRSNIEGIRDIAEETIRVCTVAALDLEEIGDSAKVEEVDSSLRSLIDSQYRLGVERELMTRLATQLDTETADSDYLTAWEDKVSRYDGQSEAQKYGKNSQYRDFRQQIWDVKHEGAAMPSGLFGGDGNGDGEDSDEDLVIAGTKLNYRCPVSASWLVEPLTSKVCNHSYSKEAILGYIRAHSGTCDCPVDGCRKKIKAKDLFADQVLERKVARHLRQLEAEETAAQYTLVQ
ncbi:hypothetical protein LPJ61_002663 [Coemansia biformis]|uniref:SP-RING-type domain-containing protein n=1 Tax=Coemansia biformis TaxID=1286918 RepID=A0A9W7YEJ1_9FUNG|nr:hypothetical protein LPJ61_002663 [Coemansia biformis]